MKLAALLIIGVAWLVNGDDSLSCPFTSCSYFKNAHKFNHDAFKRCPLSKSCPHFVKPLEDHHVQLHPNCPFLKHDWDPTSYDKGKCPLDGRCPMYATFKERGMEGCPLTKNCPHYKGYWDQHSSKHAHDKHCPYLSKHKVHVHMGHVHRQDFDTGESWTHAGGESGKCPHAHGQKCPHCDEKGCEKCAQTSGQCPHAHGQKCPHCDGKGCEKCAQTSGKCPYAHGQKCPHCDGKGCEKCAHKSGHDGGKESAGYFDAVASSVFFPQDPGMASVTAVGYISLLPISMLSIIPINVPVSVLNSLVAFAIGGLLGDVFLHLLPHAFSPHDHHGHADEHRGHAHTHEHGEHEHGHSDHGHEHHDDEHTRNMRIGLSVLGGFMLFFLLEKIMRALGRVHSHEEDTEKKTPTPTGSLQLAAYLNLLADAMHNFTDGLAIAAAFHTSRALGITTTIACFFHEIPHEVGDFVILIRSGFSRQQAILMQVVTAFGAMAGVLVGNYLGSLDASVSQVILPATAGGFVYIATVGVVPELLENTKPSKWLGVISEVAMMSLGVALMAWIALNE